MKNGGYTLIKPPPEYPGKRYRNGLWAYEHIVEFWRREGRMPKPGHVVHHVNEDKRDNTWANLEEKPKTEHAREHGLKPMTHGTPGAYRRGCRCIPCKQASKECQARWRAKKSTVQ